MSTFVANGATAVDLNAAIFCRHFPPPFRTAISVEWETRETGRHQKKLVKIGKIMFSQHIYHVGIACSLANQESSVGVGAIGDGSNRL